MRQRIQDVMVRSVVAVDESTPFKKLIATLSVNSVSAVPVLDPEGAVVGVVHERDLLVKEEGAIPAARRLLHPGRAHDEAHKLRGLVARDLMSTPPVTIRPTESIPSAARLMTEREVGRLPVVDELGRCVGIVTRRDLLRVYLRPDDEIREEIEHRVVPETLCMDPARLPVRVKDGVVTVEGRVERKGMLPLIASIIMEVDGVVDVVMRTTFEQDDTVHLWAEAVWPPARTRSA